MSETTRSGPPHLAAAPAVISPWVRAGGIAAILGGALWIVRLALTAAQPPDPERGPGPYMPLLFTALLGFAFGALGI